jgi:hypothetical protein
MAATQKLKRFHIEQDGDMFLLTMEDETGETFEVSATHDQVDLIADSLDEALDADEESESVEDEEEG